MTHREIVFTHGVFDLLHSNHIRALETAKAFGNHLLVGVNSDAVAASYKRRPILDQEERLAQVRALACVDEAFIDPLPPEPQSLEAQIKEIGFAHYVYFGEGWDAYFEPCIRHGLLRRLPYHDGICTSKIIAEIAKRCANNLLP